MYTHTHIIKQAWYNYNKPVVAQPYNNKTKWIPAPVLISLLTLDNLSEPHCL